MGRGRLLVCKVLLAGAVVDRQGRDFTGIQAGVLFGRR